MLLVESVGAQALLLAVDRLESVPWESLSTWKGRLLLVTTEHNDEFEIKREDTHVFDGLHATLSRMDRSNLGLLLAASQGLLNEKHSVVCVTGPDGRRLDSITITKPEVHFRAMLSEKNRRGLDIVRPAVVLRDRRRRARGSSGRDDVRRGRRSQRAATRSTVSSQSVPRLLEESSQCSRSKLGRDDERVRADRRRVHRAG